MSLREGIPNGALKKKRRVVDDIRKDADSHMQNEDGGEDEIVSEDSETNNGSENGDANANGRTETNLPGALRPLLTFLLKREKKTMYELLHARTINNRVDVSSMIRDPLSATQDRIRRLIIRLKIRSIHQSQHVRDVFDREKRTLLRKEGRNPFGVEAGLFLSYFPELKEKTGDNPNGAQRLVRLRVKMSFEELAQVTESVDRGDAFPFPKGTPMHNWRCVRAFLTSFDEPENSNRFKEVADTQKRREVVIAGTWLQEYIRKTYAGKTLNEQILFRDTVIQEFFGIVYSYADEIYRGMTASYFPALQAIMVSGVLNKRSIADGVDAKVATLRSRDEKFTRRDGKTFRSGVSENDLAPVRKPSRR